MFVAAVEKFETILHKICLEVDAVLEEKYGKQLPLHPNRLEEGEAANGQMDGLFNVYTTFTAGFGSQFGRGEIIGLQIGSLEEARPELLEEIWETLIDFFEKKLHEYAPERACRIQKDGPVYKILSKDFRSESAQ